MTGTFRPLFGWRKAITVSGLPATTRHVALTISLHMNEAGESCFPSQATLAEETGLSRETVNRHVQALFDSGLLEVGHRRRVSDGLQTSNEYRAAVPPRIQALLDAEAAAGSTEWRSRCDGGSHPGVTEDHTGCDGGSHHEDVLEGVLEGESSSRKPAAPAAKHPDAERLTGLLLASYANHSDSPPRKLTTKAVQDMDRLLRLGPVGWAEPQALDVGHVERVIHGVFDLLAARRGASEFCWADQIQSPGNLRKHWDRLRAELNAAAKKPAAAAGGRTAEQEDRLARGKALAAQLKQRREGAS